MFLTQNYLSFASTPSPLSTQMGPGRICKKMQLLEGPFEGEDKYSLSINVQGVLPEDIAVVRQGRHLVVEFEKEFNPHKVAQSSWDKAYGVFTRTFELPEDTDASGMAYAVADGCLEIEMLKENFAMDIPEMPLENNTLAPQNI